MKSIDSQLYGLTFELTSSTESDGTTCFCVDDGQKYVTHSGIWYPQPGSYWCVGGTKDGDTSGLTASLPASPSDLDRFNAVDSGVRYIGWGGHWYAQPIPWTDDSVILAAEAQPLENITAGDISYDPETTYLDGSVGAIIQETAEALDALDSGDVPFDDEETYPSTSVGWQVSTLKSEIEAIEKYAGIKGPAELQQLVAAGKAREFFDIGDIITIPWTDYTPGTPVTYQTPFVVVHIGDAYDEDDVLHKDALWLMSMYGDSQDMVFDEKEDTVVNLSTEPNALAGWYYWGLDGTDQYTALNLSAGDAIPTTHASVHKCAINNLSVLRYGYNRWSMSAIRQWLNSKAAKNENWWTPQHDGDVSPTTTYTNKPGWLYGFAPEWLEIFKPVRVETATNTVTDEGVTDTTYDTFFLPSLEQMYGVPQAAGVEGEYWEYWKEETGMDAPSNGSAQDPNDARKIPPVNNFRANPVYCRLRSAHRSTSNAAWTVYTGGYLTGNAANSAYRCQPACVIF